MIILPRLVARLTEAHNAWIVGSAANPDVNAANVRDWDVAVPFQNWDEAALLIPGDAKPNTFGGWKVITEGVEIDVWPTSFECFHHHKTPYMWHPSTNTRLKRI